MHKIPKTKIKEVKRSNGRIALFLVTTGNGKRVRETTDIFIEPNDSKATQKSKREQAEALAEKMNSERTLGILPNLQKDSNVYVSDFIDVYEEYRNACNIKNTGIVRCVKRFMREFNPKLQMRDFNENVFRSLISFLTNKYKSAKGGSLSNGTIKTYINFINSMLNYAVKKRYIAKNPYKELETAEKPKRTKDKRDFLTKEEVQRIIDKADNTPTKRAFIFACYCGLRLSDIRALKWNDLNQINSEKVIVNITTKKTGQVVTIPIGKNAMSLCGDKKNDYIFSDLQSNQTIGRQMTKICKEADIKKKITFHSSRHTFAVHILMEGNGVYTLQELLGHTDIETTMRYADIVNEYKDKATLQHDSAYSLGKMMQNDSEEKQ